MILSLSGGTIDTAMIAMAGDTAVGSVGIANQIVGFLTLAYQIIGSSSAIVLGQYIGGGLEKRPGALDKVYSVALAFNFCLSAIICFVVVAFAQALLKALQTPLVMERDALDYLRIVGCFLFCQSIGSVIVAAFNVHGKTYIGLVVFLLMESLNVTGNYFFLCGPLKYLGLRVRGVAISTSFSSLAATITLIVLFKKVLRGRVDFAYLLGVRRGDRGSDPPLNLLKKLLKLGVPAAGESISYSLAQIFVTGVVNVLGPLAVTTKAYCAILANFNLLFSSAIAEGTSIITAQSVGALDYDFAYKRVKKSAAAALILSAIIAVLNWKISRFSLLLFTKDCAIITLAGRILFISCFLELGRCLNLVVIRSMRAAGDVLFPVIMGVVSMWLVLAGGAFLLGVRLGLGLRGVWFAMAADEILRAVIAVFRWRIGAWRGRSLVKKET